MTKKGLLENVSFRTVLKANGGGGAVEWHTCLSICSVKCSQVQGIWVQSQLYKGNLLCPEGS